MRRSSAQTQPVVLDIAARGVEVCPECGALGLTPVSNGESVQFLCMRCRCCWRLQLGSVYRMNPARCPGCGQRSVCTTAPRPYGTPAVPGAAV